MKISDIRQSDHLRVTYYPGHTPVEGVAIVDGQRHAGRGGATSIRLANGQTVRVKSKMKIEKIK